MQTIYLPDGIYHTPALFAVPPVKNPVDVDTEYIAINPWKVFIRPTSGLPSADRNGIVIDPNRRLIIRDCVILNAGRVGAKTDPNSQLMLDHCWITHCMESGILGNTDCTLDGHRCLIENNGMNKQFDHGFYPSRSTWSLNRSILRGNADYQLHDFHSAGFGTKVGTSDRCVLHGGRQHLLGATNTTMTRSTVAGYVDVVGDAGARGTGVAKFGGDSLIIDRGNPGSTLLGVEKAFYWPASGSIGAYDTGDGVLSGSMTLATANSLWPNGMYADEKFVWNTIKPVFPGDRPCSALDVNEQNAIDIKVFGVSGTSSNAWNRDWRLPGAVANGAVSAGNLWGLKRDGVTSPSSEDFLEFPFPSHTSGVTQWRFEVTPSPGNNTLEAKVTLNGTTYTFSLSGVAGGPWSGIQLTNIDGGLEPVSGTDFSLAWVRVTSRV